MHAKAIAARDADFRREAFILRNRLVAQKKQLAGPDVVDWSAYPGRQPSE